MYVCMYIYVYIVILPKVFFSGGVFFSDTGSTIPGFKVAFGVAAPLSGVP